MRVRSLLSGILDIMPGTAYIARVEIDANGQAGARESIAGGAGGASLFAGGVGCAVGVTRQTISAIETGRYCPSAWLAFRLAQQLGKPVDELFFLQGDSA